MDNSKHYVKTGSHWPETSSSYLPVTAVNCMVALIIKTRKQLKTIFRLQNESLESSCAFLTALDGQQLSTAPSGLWVVKYHSTAAKASTEQQITRASVCPVTSKALQFDRKMSLAFVLGAGFLALSANSVTVVLLCYYC